MKFIELFIKVAIAIGFVYGISWLAGKSPDEIVGWAALGIAIGKSTNQ